MGINKNKVIKVARIAKDVGPWVRRIFKGLKERKVKKKMEEVMILLERSRNALVRENTMLGKIKNVKLIREIDDLFEEVRGKK